MERAYHCRRVRLPSHAACQHFDCDRVSQLAVPHFFRHRRPPVHMARGCTRKIEQIWRCSGRAPRCSAAARRVLRKGRIDAAGATQTSVLRAPSLHARQGHQYRSWECMTHMGDAIWRPGVNIVRGVNNRAVNVTVNNSGSNSPFRARPPQTFICSPKPSEKHRGAFGKIVYFLTALRAFATSENRCEHCCE